MGLDNFLAILCIVLHIMNESGHWAVFTGQVCYLIFEPLLAGPEPAVLQWSMKRDTEC